MKTLKRIPRSPTRDELLAQLARTLMQQVLPDSEMRAHGYSEAAIRDSSIIRRRRKKT